MTDGIPTSMFVDVLNQLHTKIDNGFNGVYLKIDGITQNHNKTVDGCNKRFRKLEKRAACENGAESVRKEGRDFWKYVIRAVVVACALGLLGGVWKLHEVYNTLSTLAKSIN